MKTRLVSSLLVLGFAIILTACSKKDDPKPPAIVGTWAVDTYYWQDLPANFTSWQGGYSLAFFGQTSNTLTINNNKTYTWRVKLDGPDFEDSGKWTMTETKLTLTSDNSSNGAQEFKIEDTITATQMILSQPMTYNLVPDAVADTLDWSNTVSVDSAFSQYGQAVDLTEISLFEK